MLFFGRVSAKKQHRTRNKYHAAAGETIQAKALAIYVSRKVVVDSIVRLSLSTRRLAWALYVDHILMNYLLMELRFDTVHCLFCPSSLSARGFLRGGPLPFVTTKIIK